jgi:hypothetical protein
MYGNTDSSRLIGNRNGCGGVIRVHKHLNASQEFSVLQSNGDDCVRDWNVDIFG